ncbi:MULTISPECIES: hypothetical protein [unclassified Moorena]|nr:MULTISPECIES: hypothetical protein [unclassified Moorena]
MYPGRGGVGREGGVWEVREVWGEGSGQMGERAVGRWGRGAL